jgi:hypothetical protein
MSKADNPTDYLYSFWDINAGHRIMGENLLGMHPNDGMLWYGIAGFLYVGASVGVYLPLAPKLNLNPRNLVCSYDTMTR